MTWGALRSGSLPPRRAAKKNTSRNRAEVPVPYDEHRVVLQNAEKAGGYDYVNASMIFEFHFANNKVHPPTKYIAAMGPMAETSPHFLQMLMEQKAPAVVALTRCEEKGKEKCHEYWPTKEENVKIHGDFEVRLISDEKEKQGVWIRVVEIHDTKNHSEGKPHRFLHFHYVEWSDFGVVRPSTLVHLIRLFREELSVMLPEEASNQQHHPIVVHCSGGVGRSGVFIAVDHLIQDIPTQQEQQAAATIDVFGCVYEMRMRRPMMVYTRNQYVLVYITLLYVINGGNEDEALSILEKVKRNREVLE